LRNSDSQVAVSTMRFNSRLACETKLLALKIGVPSSVDFHGFCQQPSKGESK
jgi:hypothetical protein